MFGSRLKWCKMIGEGPKQLQDSYRGGDRRKMPSPGNVQRPDRGLEFNCVLLKDQVKDAVSTEEGNRKGRQLVR